MQSPQSAPETDRELRRRIAIEVSLLAVLTPLFLCYAPRRGSLFILLAVLFLIFILAGAKHTRERVWGAPRATATERRRHAATAMFLFTAPVALGLILVSPASHRELPYVRLLAACAIYFPWALAQQSIFQFYLLGRLRALAPRAPSYLLSLGNGIAYGLVHAPHTSLMLLTGLVGTVWSYSYLRDRALVPIAASHAVLGATYYCVFVGRDLIGEIARFLGMP
jgi:hypothetical protein